MPKTPSILWLKMGESLTRVLSLVPEGKESTLNVAAQDFAQMKSHLRAINSIPQFLVAA